MTTHHAHAPTDPKIAARRRLRPERTLPAAPLAAGPRAEKPLPDPSDWTFELIESYHEKIRAAAQRYALDTYPNQLEVITAEQMMDAYASVTLRIAKERSVACSREYSSHRFCSSSATCTYAK